MEETPTAKTGWSSRHLQRITSNNLQKSLDILEEAVKPSPEFQRVLRSNYSPSEPRPRQPVDDTFDATFSPLITAQHSILTDFKDHTFVGEVSLSKATFTEEADLESAVESCRLLEDFMIKLDNYPATHQMFELVESYETLCRNRAELLKPVFKKLIPSQGKHSGVAQTLLALQQECYTWNLLHVLYYDRLQNEGTSDLDGMLVDNLGKRLSPKQIAQSLYERDASVRLNQLVIDWLEKMASDSFEDNYYDRVEYFSSQHVAWENTLHQLLQQKKKVPVRSERATVDELDPDAPIRTKKPLHDLDKEDEARFLKYLFFHIRAGLLEKAQRLCQNCGQSWRAAALEGWKLYHDPNYEGVDPDGYLQPTQGNQFRDVWKAASWWMSENENIPSYERAIFAALSGNLQAVLPACSSWEDYLWAHFRTMVDIQVEQELRNHVWTDRPLEPLPTAYWNKVLTPEVIFQELHASTNPVILEESKHFFRVVQKLIILDNVDGLIEEMYERVNSTVNIQHHHLRFMAHLVLFFRSVGRGSKEELSVSILEAYVKFLIRERRLELVPFYTAKLTQELQVHWYSKFLENITDTDERQECLQLAEKAGLDIPRITKTVVENIRSRPMSLPHVNSDISTETTDEDQQKIDALEWLVFDRAQRAEALRQANSLMRYFLSSQKLDAAQRVFAKIPPDSIDVILKQWFVQTKSNKLPGKDENATREYLCMQAYLHSHVAFNDWFEHFHHGKPDKPILPERATFTERVAFEHQERQYQADLERWRHSLDHQTRRTVEKMYNVLLFVDGGWLVDQSEEDSPDLQRQIQLQHLRQLCLPRLVGLLHCVLHSTAQYRECLQLADVVAAEQHRLYTVFSKVDLRQFLVKLQESSQALLDQGCDPLGYPIS